MRLFDKRMIVVAVTALMAGVAMAGERYNFNAQWKLALGEVTEGANSATDDRQWQTVTLPYAWNQAEAYSRNCSELSDTVMWYRKHFNVPSQWKGRRVFVEFEGARFGAHAYLNGEELGWSDNGVMAFGFDLTPYIKYGKDNVLSIRVDNDWKYKEHIATWSEKEQKEVRSGYQWNDKNFYCNYGGLNKNVWLHVMPEVYQTLPLYSNLGTTGTYVYATNYDVKNRTATVNCESQVVNSSRSSKTVEYRVQMIDADGKEVASFTGDKRTVAAGDTVVLKACHTVGGLHFWSWGYGYLYTVKTSLVVNGKATDTAETQTGFRKTEFKDGMFYLNDRVLQLKGFAQRSTNEWPALGISIPAWMSDYSNRQILECNGNFVRWMHVTPSKQDIRSFDRLGLIQAMPAGDAEKDVTDRRWQHRCEVMRDAIIYNRNNPSIIFYEGGNNQISEEHMAELKAIRDMYDPNGGRAIGSRNMLDSKVAEYGGEMLYVNKSAGKPMWQMEYNRDEGIRRYWDEWSYPYHKEGDGPLYRGDRAVAYNHNQDGLAVENIVRWNEYWMARPGNGKRVNSGGAKIIFSDSNTHARGEKNYRTSGDVDAMRIPKDSWFCHKVMWNGWVDTEKDGTYIIGHWNYEEIENGKLKMDNEAGASQSADFHFSPFNSQFTKPVYVCSTGDEVELFLNGKSLGNGKRSDTFLFTWDSVRYEPGTLTAVAYKNGKKIAEDKKETVGEPVALRMRWISEIENGKLKMENEAGASQSANFQFSTFNSQFTNSQFLADGSDIRIAEIEAVDAQGRRHPLAHDMIQFSVEGEGDYIGGISGVVSEEQREANRKEQETGVSAAREGHNPDTNGIGSKELMLEAGVIRVMVRSHTKAGEITLTATPIEKGTALKPATLTAKTVECMVKDGFYVDDKGKATEADRAKQQPLFLLRGETPATPSYTQKYNTVAVKEITAAVNADKVQNIIDDDEASEWSSDSKLENSWVKVTLEREAAIAQVVLRLKSFRSTSYPLQIFAGEQLVWEGYTPKSLGDCYLPIANPVKAKEYTIKMVGPATVKEAFGSMTELAAKNKVSTKESKSNILSIIELSMNESSVNN